MFASPVLEHSLRDTRTIVADRPKRKGKECYQPIAAEKADFGVSRWQLGKSNLSLAS
jgi:hypothetical protein